MSPDNLESSDELRDLAQAPGSHFEAARTERRKLRERNASKALALCKREDSEYPKGIQVDPYLRPLSHLIVCVLPRLDGHGIEFLFTKMEQLLERRREAELKKRAK